MVKAVKGERLKHKIKLQKEEKSGPKSIKTWKPQMTQIHWAKVFRVFFMKKRNDLSSLRTRIP